MRVIVTGATGFIGSNLTFRLLADRHEVHLIVRRQADFWRLETKRNELFLHPVELDDPQGLKQTFLEIQPHWIFHLATFGAYSFQDNLAQMVATNIMGTANVLQACEASGFEAVVIGGSSSEYGFKNHAPKETDFLEPNSYYAVTKAASTFLSCLISRRLQLPITTLRLYSAYGPYEEPTRLLPRLIMFGFKREYPPLVSPHVARDFVYVDDIVEAFLLAAKTSPVELGAIYNVGSGLQSRIQDIVEIVRNQLSIESAPPWGKMENRLWDTAVWVADSSKIRRDLQWQPKVALESGIAKMIHWLRDNKAMYGRSLQSC